MTDILALLQCLNPELEKTALRQMSRIVLGFLAYDIVLIVPFLTWLPTTPPEHQLGLNIYTAVVTFSGLLAIYYLFIHKPTRIRPRMSPN